MPVVLACPDKYRGSATATQLAAAIGSGAWDAGWDCDEAPVADGGEGTLEALGGRVRRTVVSGPLREQVHAEWRLDGRTAVIETARVAGLDLVGGAEGNDPMGATTVGVGELIAHAVVQGARKVIVGLGGSASTDGGEPCLAALEPHSRLKGVELVAACDVTTRFVDAARVFAPQKGASPAEVQLLTRRLERLAQVYEDRFGVDVRDLEGGGAAGGLGGGLAAIGARLEPGFDLVADAIELDGRMEEADLVVTGEGFLDEQTFAGKAVGGVLELAERAKRPVLVIAGEVLDGVVPADLGAVTVVSLVERFGRERALGETLRCVSEVVRTHLQSFAR